MLTIRVDLLQGVIRASSADDLTLSGEADPGDWPPNPARLVSAFIAADGTRQRCRITDGSELAVLEQAGSPVILADPRSLVLDSRQRERFVVENQRGEGHVQEYLARSPSPPVRPSTRLAPRHPWVIYIWERVDPSDGELEMLARRAARIGYLGCADSPVRVSVSREPPPEQELSAWNADPEGRHVLPIPFPGMVEVLDRAYDEWAIAGKPVRRSWYRVERARYRAPDDVSGDTANPWPYVFWLRFERAVPGRWSLAVTESLKSAVLDLYQRRVLGADVEMPWVLHGHAAAGSGYRLAQWLVLPEVGHRYATGRLHGAAVMLPAGVSASVANGLRTTLWGLQELFVPGRGTIHVRPYGGEAYPLAARPDRWRKPSRRWVSALPVVHERWTHRGATLEDVGRWCTHAGIVAPIRTRLSPHGMISGAVELTPDEVFRNRPGTRHPYSHLLVEFAKPVSGPLVLGRARQFGLGLMLPLRDSS